VPVGETVAIIVEEASDVAAFASYSEGEGAAAPVAAAAAAPAAAPAAGSFPEHVVSCVLHWGSCGAANNALQQQQDYACSALGCVHLLLLIGVQDVLPRHKCQWLVARSQQQSLLLSCPMQNQPLPFPRQRSRATL
jgi:hypothetical protein